MKLSFAFVLAGLSAFAAASDFAIEKRATDIDTTILQYALTLEHLEANFYANAPSASAFKKAGYPAYVHQRIQELAGEEASHVALLTAAIGSGATQACTYEFGYTNVDQFLAVSRVLEGVGVSAYTGAANLITSKQYLTVAASILAVEAEHVGEISTFQGADGSPSAYATPLDFSQVYSLAAPFIKSCPKSNPTLPVTDFPTLSVKATKPTAGSTITLDWKNYNKKTKYYVHFLNGLSDTVSTINDKWQVHIPKTASGTVYIVVSTSKTLTDKNTVAGPAILQLPYNSHE